MSTEHTNGISDSVDGLHKWHMDTRCVHVFMSLLHVASQRVYHRYIERKGGGYTVFLMAYILNSYLSSLNVYENSCQIK